MALAMGSLLVAPLSRALISLYDWRTAMFMFGPLIAFGSFVTLWVLSGVSDLAPHAVGVYVLVNFS